MEYVNAGAVGLWFGLAVICWAYAWTLAPVLMDKRKSLISRMLVWWAILPAFIIAWPIVTWTAMLSPKARENALKVYIANYKKEG